MATGKKDAHTVKSKSSKSKKAGVIQVSKVEHEIDEFLENFRRKSSTLDQPQSTELCDSLRLPHASYSSSQCSTDECTDESPDRAYFIPQKPFVKGHRHQYSNTTSESEWGPDCDEEISKEEIIQQLNSRAALIETETAKTEQGTVFCKRGDNFSVFRRSFKPKNTSSTCKYCGTWYLGWFTMFTVRTKLIDQISCTYLISYYLNELYRTLQTEDVGWLIHHIPPPPKVDLQACAASCDWVSLLLCRTLQRVLSPYCRNRVSVFTWNDCNFSMKSM